MRDRWSRLVQIGAVAAVGLLALIYVFAGKSGRPGPPVWAGAIATSALLAACGALFVGLIGVAVNSHTWKRIWSAAAAMLMLPVMVVITAILILNVSGHSCC